ncbi:MAG: hypothetical protein ACP5OA_01775 [Candidatus Woesearchaeota archaeon]
MKAHNKKGYYFIIDAFIGSTIIFLSLMVILNEGNRPSAVQYNYEMAEEYSTFILSTKLQDLSNPYVDNLTAQGKINDTSLTIMEQVDLFYYNNNLTDARDMIKNLTDPLISEKYGFSYSIINGSTYTNIYNRSSVSLENAKMVIASRKITFLHINSSTMFGPAMTEIKIWV